jgi:hypothetical protein
MAEKTVREKVIQMAMVDEDIPNKERAEVEALLTQVEPMINSMVAMCGGAKWDLHEDYQTGLFYKMALSSMKIMVMPAEGR